MVLPVETLLLCPLFRKLAPDELENLLDSITCHVKYFYSEEVIAISGEKIEAMMIVMEGSVRGEMIDFSGKTIKIEDIESPRPLAPAFLFGARNFFPVTIVANEGVKLLFIPKTSFIRMMQLNDRILDNFMNIISSRAQFLSDKIRFLSFHTLKGKIAFYLLEKVKLHGSDSVKLDKSQAQLAELFGVTRPSLGRVLSDLSREGIIKHKAREVTILDAQKLTAYLS